MIIGEFNTSDFDGYEEDSYDYLFKKKPKGTRQEKRLVRKENKQPKKGGFLKGKRKLPLLGNFGMFDKNKKKKQLADAGTPETSFPSDENLSTAPSAPPEPASLPEPVVAPIASGAPGPTTTSSNEGMPIGPEIQIPSSKINAIVPKADNVKEDEPTEVKSILPGSVAPKIQVKGKETVTGSDVKKAGFSSLLGFAFLGITIILVGFAIYKVDKKSNLQPIQ
jgi:hypothetical protein